MAPNRARFHFDQGLNFFQQEEYEKAATYFKEAMMEDPQFHEALYNLACCTAVTGDKDNALIYLARAVKLNLSSMDWAKEDKEFDGIRNDPIFARIVSGGSTTSSHNVEEVFEEEAVAEEFKEAVFENAESTAPPPELDKAPNFIDQDSKTAKTEDLPPCLFCGGMLHTEKMPRFSPLFTLAVILLGFLVIFCLYISPLGILGLPILAMGLFSFTLVDKVWVCNSCGSKGEKCGQPKATRATKRAGSTSELTP